MDLGFGHSLEFIKYVRPEEESRHTTDPTVLGGSILRFRVEDEDIVGTLADMVSKGAKSLNSPAEVS